MQIYSSFRRIWSSAIFLILWLNLSTSLIPIYFFNPSIFLAVDASDVLWRWVTFVSLHNYGWAQVGVRFHIQRAFVINMAANSLSALVQPARQHLVFHSQMIQCMLFAPCARVLEMGEQFSSSNRGAREWAEAGWQHLHVLHSLFTAGFQKKKKLAPCIKTEMHVHEGQKGRSGVSWQD